MVTRPEIAITGTAETDRAIATITTAFVDDPVTRWVFRDAHTYLTYWPKTLEAFGGAAFEQGTADAVDDCGGVGPLAAARRRSG